MLVFFVKHCQFANLFGAHFAQVIYNEVAYFAPYGANHVGIFDLKSEHFGDWDGLATDGLEMFWMNSCFHALKGVGKDVPGYCFQSSCEP